MYRQVPNQLTVLRLLLAGVFFLVLGFYRYPEGPAWALPAAITIFLIAVATDILDGHLARKWKAESVFGRIMDPFCDKVLILGAFIFMAGPRFVGRTGPDLGPFNIVSGNMVSGVYPWMVALMLARELLVTGIRGELEGEGVKFGANFFGKLKMILQSGMIPLVLLIVHCDPAAPGHAWTAVTRDALVYVTVTATALSGLPYIFNAVRALSG